MAEAIAFEGASLIVVNTASLRRLIDSSKDYLAIVNIAFTWSTSYDTKDWELLRTRLAPSIKLDFRSLQGQLHDALSPDEYVSLLSDVKMIGDRRLKTQHLMGATKWSQPDNDTIEVVHQMRVAHQRYTDETLTTVANKGHAYGFVIHKYGRYDGLWEIKSVQPDLVWTEYDLFGTLNPVVG